MPQQREDGLGYISQNFRDLFRKLDGPLAYKDPIELKPPTKVKKASAEEIGQDFYPMGICCVKIRMPGEKIAADAVVKSEYMKWAIATALASTLNRMGKMQAGLSDILFCADEIEVLDVQMPYLGDNLWQFCEFRFDYKLRVKSPEVAAMVCQQVFVRMKDFEATFCQSLEVQFQEIYNMTVLKLMNKRFLLMDGLEISNQLALYRAAKTNNTNAMASLVGNGTDVNAFQKAVRFPSSLLDDEDERFAIVTLSRTPLLAAAEEGHIEAMKLLLEAQADITYTDSCGFHALYLAAGAPNSADQAVKFLLSNGASLDLANNSGYTALHNACGSGEVGAITALLEAKADLNLKSHGGAAPVHVAAINDQREALETLKKAKANLDMPAFGGNTPVHEAVMTNNADLLQKLFELGADVNIESGPDHGFATPLKMAMERNKKKAMRKLKELGAIEKVEHEYEEVSEADLALAAAGKLEPRVKGRLYP